MPVVIATLRSPSNRSTDGTASGPRGDVDLCPGRPGHLMLTAGPLLGTNMTGANSWRVNLADSRLAYLGDHRLNGTVVVPAACYLEMLLSVQLAAGTSSDG